MKQLQSEIVDEFKAPPRNLLLLRTLTTTVRQIWNAMIDPAARSDRPLCVA
jgi:hypothetical protein